MGHDLERPDDQDISFTDTIIYADFNKKILIGKGKAKEFKKKS